MAIMKDALIAALNLPSINIHATVRRGLDDAQDNVNKRIALLKEAVAGIKRHRKAMKRKNKGVNLFHVLADQEVTILTNLIEERLPALVKYIMEARRMFDDYEQDARNSAEAQMFAFWRD
jgi:hypothetical protein